MLAEAVPNKSTIFEENGGPITKHKGFLSMRFLHYNLTVDYYRAPFLVVVGHLPQDSPSQVRVTEFMRLAGTLDRSGSYNF